MKFFEGWQVREQSGLEERGFPVLLVFWAYQQLKNVFWEEEGLFRV